MTRNARTRVSCLVLAVGLVLGARYPAHGNDTFTPELFAFFNGMPKVTPEKEATLLKELGYAGISQIYDGGAGLTKRIEAYKKHDVKILSVYLNATETPIAKETVRGLPPGGIIELTVKRIRPRTVDAIRKTVEMAAKLELRVAIYPHHGFAVATIPQALELIEEVNHPNLGLMFNLCHFLKNERVEDLEATLEKAAPHLFSVSTAGADTDGKKWGSLIQTLNKGTFPQTRLFSILKRLDFKGPVGLQCYGVRGNKKDNLKTSIEAWNNMLGQLKTP